MRDLPIRSAHRRDGGIISASRPSLRLLISSPCRRCRPEWSATSARKLPGLAAGFQNRRRVADDFIGGVAGGLGERRVDPFDFAVAVGD